MTNRREFLQTTAIAVASCIFPESIFATPSPNFHFIHSDTLNHWPALDPVQWSLEHAHDPILSRAAECLGKLSVNDADRIIRLVVRRCSLNLLELQPGKVVVDHWGPNQSDLRPFFKTHGLARPGIEVVLRNRKKETNSKTTGDSFLYGVPIAPDFDMELFQTKWEGRFKQESDDWQATPNTSSGYAWEGLADGAVPWSAMKSAWRRSGPGRCLNCEGGTFLVNFGVRQVGMFNRSPNFVHVCGACRRSFNDDTVKDVRAWIVLNLGEGMRPDAELMWGKRVKVELKA